MADITVTITDVTKSIFGNKRIDIASLAVSGGNLTMPAGGVSLPASAFGLQAIEFFKADGGSFIYKYDYTNSKLMGYTAAASGRDATVVLIEASGVTPSGVSSATDTFRALVVGYGIK